ncbi:MAG: NADH-quinone oxidoreductase subunit N [Bdellovibrionales bacterium]|nr:NADH-quinone oxidoreductase subunit N [Bdellovibrionales bacterium]
MEIQFGLIDFLLVAPAVALFVMSCVPLLIKVMRGNQEQNTMATLVYAYTGVFAAMGFCLPTIGATRTAFEGALVFDGVSAFATIVILFCTAVALTFARDSQSTNPKQFTETVFLMMNAAVGMLTMVWANDLIIVFVGLELFSLCLYMMIAMSLEEKVSKEAAFKYFILGSFASALMLYGISFIYGTVGSTYLPELLSSTQNLLATNRLFLLGFVLLIVGLLFKAAVFPFHAWAPDVYQGAPTPLTAFMATGVKAATLAFFLRLVASQAFTVERFWPFVDVMQWMIVLTILIGNVGAFRQRSLKRMLAYSSIAHSGYVMIGMIAAGIGGASMLGATGVMFYIVSYAIMTIGAFGVLHMLEPRPDSDLTVEDLRGLAARKPWLALALTVLLLSLTGIPPTVGFFGKFFLFSAAVKQGLIWLAVWGVIGSIISVYYYLRPVVAMYMEEPVIAPAQVNMRPLSYFAVSFLALLVLVFGIASEPLYQVVLASVAKVF